MRARVSGRTNEGTGGGGAPGPPQDVCTSTFWSSVERNAKAARSACEVGLRQKWIPLSSQRQVRPPQLRSSWISRRWNASNRMPTTKPARRKRSTSECSNPRAMSSVSVCVVITSTRCTPNDRTVSRKKARSSSCQQSRK